MTLEVVRNALGWCFLINLGILMWWFLFLVFAHDWVYKMHTKWFKMSVEQFNAIHYTGMMLFKLFIFATNLVPYLALWIVG